MKNKSGINVECIFIETLDFIDINYTNLNQTIRYEQRPHGEWIDEGQYAEGHGHHAYHCKNCGYHIIETTDMISENRFCKNCGADMRKEGDEK